MAGVAVEVQSWKAPRTQGGLVNPSVLHLLACDGREGTLAGLVAG